VSPVVVALIVGAIALLVGWMLGVGVAGLRILVVIVLVAWRRASDIRAVIGDESTSATTFEASETSIDLG
jgi:membrane protein implicated in regulation of membrane protease activity